MTTATTPAPSDQEGRAPLVPADRCDRCGARAAARAVLPSGQDLLFCAHHAREAAEGLARAGAVVHAGPQG